MNSDRLLRASIDLLRPAAAVRSAIAPLRSGGSRALAALAAATVLAAVTLLQRFVESGAGWAALAPAGVPGATALVAGLLLSMMPLVLGLRPLWLAAVALPCAVFGALAWQQDFALLAVVPAPLAALAVFLVFTMWVVPDARSLIAGALVGASGALSATAGPMLAGWGAAALQPADLPAELLLEGLWPTLTWCLLPLLLAWAGAELGVFSRLRSAVTTAAMRDGLFRALTGAGVLLAAL